MKKTLLIASLVSLLSVALIACKPKTETTTPEAPQTSPQQPAETTAPSTDAQQADDTAATQAPDENMTSDTPVQPDSETKPNNGQSAE